MERISQQCWQLLLGSLLGDAWLANTKKGKRKNSYLGICHSTKQLDYFLHKFEILKELGMKNFSDKKYTKNGKTYYAVEAVTTSLPILTELRRILYPKGTKLIKRSYLNKLNEQGLAYWIMDDGSLVWHKRKRKDKKIYSTCEFYLATNCFKTHEIEIIKEWFKDRYDIDSKIRYHSSSKSFYLIINRINYLKLIPHIKPFIIPTMSYKIDMNKLGKLVEMPTAPQ